MDDVDVFHANREKVCRDFEIRTLLLMIWWLVCMQASLRMYGSDRDTTVRLLCYISSV